MVVVGTALVVVLPLVMVLLFVASIVVVIVIVALDGVKNDDVVDGIWTSSV
jgi:hypothetical protein